MEQRVVWELGRWQQSRDVPISARETRESPDLRSTARSASVTPSSPVASASRGSNNSASRGSTATAPAYDFHADVEAPVRREPPQLVRSVPAEQPANAEPARPVSRRPAAESARKPASLTVATAVQEAPETEKEGRRARKARERAEEKAREEAQKQAEAAERAEEKRRAEAEREARRRAVAESPTRSERRQARKHKHLTDGITLHEGETITLTMGGWSRGRPAVLVVTRYRAALITKMPNSLHWIPLEEISQMRLRWRFGWSLEIEGSVEFLTLHKRRRQTLVAVQELLTSEVAESRAPGGRRHHPEVTQDWCDRSIEMWETHAGQIRLFIRRHPLLVVATLVFWVPVAYYFALR